MMKLTMKMNFLKFFRNVESNTKKETINAMINFIFFEIKSECLAEGINGVNWIKLEILIDSINI